MPTPITWKGWRYWARVIVIEHGWVERDGVIIAPTLPHDALQYFPVCGSGDSKDWPRRCRFPLAKAFFDEDSSLRYPFISHDTWSYKVVSSTTASTIRARWKTHTGIGLNSLAMIGSPPPQIGTRAANRLGW